MAVAVPRRAALRVAVWAFHMVLPLLGLWLLIAQPHFDVVLEHHVGHFGLVVAVAAVNVALGVRMSEVARQRADARLFLVSLVFLSSAGFLLLHALATPQVLLTGRNAGFAIATPVGLLLAAGFAALSAFDLTQARGAEVVLRHQALLRGGLVLLMAAWAVVSLLGLPPLDRPLPEEASRGPLTVMAVAAVALYAFAAARYWRLHRRRPSVMLIAVITAFALLAEAMVAVVLARNWHASWWEWHLLMAFAFAFVYYSAQVQYAREGSWSSLFRGIYLRETIDQLRREHTAALEALVETMQRPAGDGSARPIGRVVADLADRFDLTEGQAQVLEQAAQALVAEREQIQRLRALVAVGAEARVIVDERRLLERGVELTGQALRPDALRIGLVEGERLVFPDAMRAGGWPEQPGGDDGDPGDPASASLRSLEPVEEPEGDGGRLVLPLTVKDRAAGVLDVRRAEGEFADRDRWLLRALASQLSIGLENARLYRQLDGLFRQYMSPDVATALLADPTQAALGGDMAEVTVLFADLRGFTPFSERTSPERVVAMLNEYFGLAVPVLLAHGGTVVQFVGDAVMAVFNAPARQPDHARRAARAALGLQEVIEAVAEREPGWPRFRVGVNTGPALIGNIGSTEFRNFTAIGDTVNLAARLEQEVAEAGQVVIGPATHAAVANLAIARRLDPIEVKGKREPVACWVLEGLKDDPTTWDRKRSATP
jgi:adenylate cyclase